MSELKRGLSPRRRRSRDVSSNPGDPIAKRRRRRKQKKKGKRRLNLAVLPTMLTLGNGVCGMAAIAVALSAHLQWEDDQKLLVAGVFIFAGMLFDALDGSAARMTGQASKFGAELDSLCDAITFGVAPAVLVWRISTMMPHRLSWGIGVLFTLCVLIRLARFNVETDEDDAHDRFEGLPSPAAAGTLAAFAIAIPELKRISKADDAYFDSVRYLAEKSWEAAPLFVPALAVLLAYLMVSRFQYPHIQQLVRGRRSFHQIGQGLFAVVGIIVLHELALPIALCYFALASPVRSLLSRGAEAAPAANELETPAAAAMPTEQDSTTTAEQTTDAEPAVESRQAESA